MAVASDECYGNCRQTALWNDKVAQPASVVKGSAGLAFPRVHWRGDLQPVEVFEAKIRFSLRKANENSLRKNHYNIGGWAIQPKDAAHSVADFLRRHAVVPVIAGNGMTYQFAQLAAHNAPFDGPFLQVTDVVHAASRRIEHNPLRLFGIA